MENILWLPSEHRPSHVPVHGSIIGFGYPPGRVTFIEFTSEGSLDLLAKKEDKTKEV
jgi:hypothetical protein